jgi:hypothetical protein
MDKPDQSLLDEDLRSVEFRNGALKGLWGQPGPELLPDGMIWPNLVFWLAAAPRPNAPERFYIRVDAADYRSVSPTGTFWDPTTKLALDIAKRPKGKQNSRFAKVFRTDWENAVAFYHPYDRFAAKSHPDWPKNQPHLIWTSNHTIVDYLEEFHSLLNCGDYLGI